MENIVGDNMIIIGTIVTIIMLHTSNFWKYFSFFALSTSTTLIPAHFLPIHVFKRNERPVTAMFVAFESMSGVVPQVAAIDPLLPLLGAVVPGVPVPATALVVAVEYCFMFSGSSTSTMICAMRSCSCR